MVRLWLEFIALYVALPAALLALRQAEGPFPVLPVLWAAALPAGVYLVVRQGWGRRELIGFAWPSGTGGRLLLRLALAAALLFGGLWLLEPALFLELPRRSPGLWALVMLLYPVLSVYPQGLLYRGLFFARYARLFGGARAQELAAAAAFCLAHLVFANVWAVALTFGGGVLLARTYRATGSLMASNIEHAAYGQLLFTAGWGRYLYHGTLRLLERIPS